MDGPSGNLAISVKAGVTTAKPGQVQRHDRGGMTANNKGS